tara:strand:- start:3636 stop:4394 length:759 start_codon:yes stop_codon:yes gene_type:complete
MFEVIVVSLTQGITEFLPVSSSAHLIIFSDLLNFTKSSLLFDVSLHIGSFLAVIIYFKKEIINFINYRKIFILILIASFPTMIVGYFLIKYNVIDNLRTLRIIGWTTIIFGIILYISDKFKAGKKIENNFNLRSSLFLGIMQTISLIPGVSRSGITISASRLLGYDRVNSAKISFLLSLPTLFAVSIYGLKTLYEDNKLQLNDFNLIGLILSFIFSYLTIILLIKFLKNFNFLLFVIYRIILGVSLIIYTYL